MALEDMDYLVSSTNQLAQTIQEIADRKEEKRRYEEEQKRLQEQTEWERQQAQKNYELQQSAFQYQQELNKQTQLREDNAFQRRIQDYKSAGLSPLGALGQQAGSGALTSLSAPQYDTRGVRDSVTESVRNSRNSIQQRMEYGLRMRQLNLEATNQALQTIKMNNEIKTEKLKREQLNEQIASSKQEREWMSTHGYRNQNWQSALISLVDNYLKQKGNNPVSIGYNGRETYDSILTPYEKTFLENVEKKEQADITKMNEKQLATLIKVINDLPKEEQKNYKNVKRAVSNELYKHVFGFYR